MGGSGRRSGEGLVAEKWPGDGRQDAEGFQRSQRCPQQAGHVQLSRWDVGWVCGWGVSLGDGYCGAAEAIRHGFSGGGRWREGK